MPIDYSKTPLTIEQAQKTRQAFQEKIETGQIVAGLSKQLETVSPESGSYQDKPFLFQATGTDSNTTETPTAPIAKHLELRGNTVEFNQLVDTDTTEVATISGHKYLTMLMSMGVNTIITSTGQTLQVQGGVDYVFDLTRMFGAGKEPTSVKQFNRLFPLHYYAYNSGELISCKSNKLVTIGYNQFNGLNEFIRVIAGQTYRLAYWTGTELVPLTSGSITEYDGLKNAIKTSAYEELTLLHTLNNTYPDNSDKGLILDNETQYVKITGSSNTNILFNLAWDGSRLDYEAFEKHEYTLPDVELRSVGDAYDSYLPDGTKIQRVIDTNNVTSLGQFNQFFNIKVSETVTSDDGQVSCVLNASDQTITLNGTGVSSSYVGGLNSYYINFDNIQKDHYFVFILNYISGSCTNITPNRNRFRPIFSGGIFSDLEFLNPFNTSMYNLRQARSSNLSTPTISFGLKENLGYTVFDNFKFKLSAIDLTQLYGAGNEPTVDEFSDTFKNAYYSYKIATANTDGSKKYYYKTTDGTNYLYNGEEVITTGLQTFVENVKVDDFGTMEFTSSTAESASNPIIPQGNRFFYPADYALLIDDLNKYTNGDVNALAKSSDVLAVGGSVTIETSDWSSNVAVKTFANMGQYDFIDFYPATTTDKTNAIAANLFVSSNGNEVTFTAVNTPSADITFNYKITRGKA